MLTLMVPKTKIMQTSLVLVLCAVAVSSIAHAETELPPYVTQCSRSNVEECVLKNVEAIRPHLEKGVARLSIPPTSPYVVPYIKVSNGDAFLLEAFNITARNIGDFQLKHFNLDFEKNVLDIEVNFPKLEAIGDYIMKGSVLGIPLDTTGRGLGAFTNLNIKATFSGELIKKDGKDYFNITTKSIEVIDMDDVYMYLYSLSVATNEVINNNSKAFLKGMGPVMETYTGAVLERTVRNVFDKYPLDNLFAK